MHPRLARALTPLLVLVLMITGCTGDASPDDSTATVTPGSVELEFALPSISLPGSSKGGVQVAPTNEELPVLGVVTPRTGVVQVQVEAQPQQGAAAEIRWPLPDEWQEAWEPVVVWDDGEGGWRWLPTHKISGSGGDVAVAQTDHFSQGFLASFDPKAFASDLAHQATSLITGRAGAAAPMCEGSDQVTDLVDVVSDAVDGVGKGDAVLWCVGVQDGEPVLKVTNNRRILAQVLIPTNATVVEQDRGISLSKGLAQLGADLEFMAQGFPHDRTVLLLEKAGTVTIQVPRDEKSGVEVSASGVGYLLSALVLGIDTYTTVAGGAGVKTTASSGDLLHLLGTGVGSAEAWAQVSVGCMRDFTDIYTDDMTAAVDMGHEVERSLTMLVSCGMKIGAASVDDSGPLGWFISAVVATIAGLVSIAMTALELLVAVVREGVDAVWGSEDAIYTVLTLPRTLNMDFDASLVVGAWSGAVDQPGSPPYNVRVTLSITGDVLHGAVEYPELGCGGHWEIVEALSERLVFVERIDYGSRCVDDVRVSIEPSEGLLLYRTLPPYESSATLAPDIGAPVGADPDGPTHASRPWPESKNDAPAGLYAWFGAASAAGRTSIGYPRWTSCVSGADLCIASDGDLIAVIERGATGFTEVHTISFEASPSESLLGLGYPGPIVDELLSP